MSKWVICAAGPSMARVDLRLLRRFRSWKVLAVNCTFRLLPHADVLYAGDLQWWVRYGAEAAGFAGEKWTRDPFAALKYRLHRVARRDGPGLCRERGCVHSGGNSGFQAVNLAWHFGARQIVLLGFDMHRREAGQHWHAPHPAPLANFSRGMPELCLPKFSPLAHDLRARGVRVINASRATALNCFERIPLPDVLAALH